MKWLALEFSSPGHSVAVVAAQTGGARVLSVVEEHPAAGGARPVAMVRRALETAGVPREQIDGLVVGLGPGSYTGIRRALALAQGWHLARAVPVLGVSSVAACALAAQQSGVRGNTLVVVDAQRNELYAALYEMDASGCREMVPLQIMSPDEARQQAAAHGAVILGPEAPRWFADGRVVFPSATALGQLACGRRDVTAPERLEPIYLRAARFVTAKAAPPAPRPGIF